MRQRHAAHVAAGAQAVQQQVDRRRRWPQGPAPGCGGAEGRRGRRLSCRGMSEGLPQGGRLSAAPVEQLPAQRRIRPVGSCCRDKLQPGKGAPACLTATQVTASRWPYSAQRGRGSSGSGWRPRPPAGRGEAWRGAHAARCRHWRRKAAAKGTGTCAACLCFLLIPATLIPLHPSVACQQKSNGRQHADRTRPPPPTHTHTPLPKAGFASHTISVVSALPVTTTIPSAHSSEQRAAGQMGVRAAPAQRGGRGAGKGGRGGGGV